MKRFRLFPLILAALLFICPALCPAEEESVVKLTEKEWTWEEKNIASFGGEVKTESLPEGKLGIFYEFDLTRIEDLMPLLSEKIQTAVCIGTDPKKLYEQARQAECPGLDRAVRAGEALEFDTIWDRKDLIGLLTE